MTNTNEPTPVPDNQSVTVVEEPRLGIPYWKIDKLQEELANKMCHAFVNVDDRRSYFVSSGKHSAERKDAAKMRVSTYLTTTRGYECELLDAELAKEIHDRQVRVLDLKSAHPHLNAMLQCRPQNPTYRAMAMATFKKMIPNDKVTYEEVRDWIEYNAQPPNWEQVIQKRGEFDGMAPTPVRNEVFVNLRVREDELGTCCYTIRKEGECEFRFTAERIMSLATASSSLRDLLQRMEYFAAERYDVNTEAVDDPQHHDYHYNTTDNRRVDIMDIEDCEDAVIEILGGIASPELFRRLGINGPG
jgi:hypothetical protein